MSFIKLTTAKHEAVYLRARLISALVQLSDGPLTSVITMYQNGVSVKETPEEIVAKISECEHGRSKRVKPAASSADLAQGNRNSGKVRLREIADRDAVASVGAKLIAYRHSIGLTCQQVSDESGIAKATLYDVESAVMRDPRRRIATATLASVKDFLSKAAEQFTKDGFTGCPKVPGYYCCLLAGGQFSRRHWNGSQWCEIQPHDNPKNTIITWQYLGRHAR